MSIAGPRTRASKRCALLCALTLAVAAVAHVVLHVKAGLSLPVPWPDEFHFMLPARALVEEGSLRTPALHPDRPVMWMPPGYTLILAPVVAIAGASLPAARWLSAVATIGTAILVWRYARRPLGGPVAAGGAALLLVHPAWIVMGNVARMEAVVLLVATAGLLLVAKQRLHVGVAVLGLSPLIHPHGLAFLVAGVVAAGLTWKTRHRPRRIELALATAVGVAWLLYAGFIAVHQDAFVEDMSFQLARKSGRAWLPSVLGPKGLQALALIAALTYRRRRRAVGWIVAVALPAWAVQRVGHEMWYHAFDALFAVLTAMVGLALLLDLGRFLYRGRYRGDRRYARAGVIVMAGVVALGFVFKAERPRWPTQIRWRHMSMSDEAYFDPADLTSLVSAVHAETSRGPLKVEVFPRGDAIFLVDAPGIEIVDPLFVKRAPDVFVYHLAPQHPPHWKRRVREKIEQVRNRRMGSIVVQRGGHANAWVAILGPPGRPFTAQPATP